MHTVFIRVFNVFIVCCLILQINAQTASISGKITSNAQVVEFASIALEGSSIGTTSDTNGFYTLKNIAPGVYKIQVSCIGYVKTSKRIQLKEGENLRVHIELQSAENELQDVVVTGTLKEISRLESPVPVEVYTPTYFKKNPTPNVYEALQTVNGVRPQLNCNVCNTGDIHINGLEGPYTMVLIDGMPMVSSLSTVYGLSGIPNSLIERIEVVKGPASSLYGSEAVGGLINVITKKPENAPVFSLDIFSTSWKEYNTDLGLKHSFGKKASVLVGLNYFNFQEKIDQNKDQFTDMTLQNRISLFQKWAIHRKKDRVFTLAGRYMYEDRWGGDVRWEKQHRGGDILYGESIYTKRWEVLGNYQLPLREKVMLSFSYNEHNQDSRYGTTIYNAQQNIAFSQITLDKKMGLHDALLGTALRYTYYDDNTPATELFDSINPINLPQKTWLPGLFIQDELTLSEKHKLLLGMRYDYNSIHGNIFTPRVAYKWTVDKKSSLRLNAGTGFRVVNLFTEDHAALTGARTIEITEALNPEKSYNANLNYIHRLYSNEKHSIDLDVSAFYTYFNNRIVADYLKDPNKIIYTNLNGYAESKGISLNLDAHLNHKLKIIAGGTLMENTLTQNNQTIQQLLTENFTGTWAVSYKIQKIHLSIDYTGNVYSPMRLPLLGENDPRQEYSPWWSIQNIQFVFTGFKNIELYGGIKNILNWTPNKGNPFIIARSFDPFDKEVQFDSQGQAIATPNNPYGLTFDPSYVYGPNQGIRGFIGVRYAFK